MLQDVFASFPPARPDGGAILYPYHFMKYSPTFSVLAALAAGVCVAPSLRAAPYASTVKNTDGAISFILNEAADKVTVKFDNGATTTELGALAAGTHSFPLGTHTSFEIIVEKNAGPGWREGVLQQISDDADAKLHLTHQRGVAVNKNPASPYFGRVYVSVSATGTAQPVLEPPSPGRAVSEGIYVLNPDLSATDLGTEALTAGLPFSAHATSTSDQSPYRIAIGEDDQLYITDWATPSGTLYVTDPDVSQGMNVLPGPQGGSNPLIVVDENGEVVGEERFHGCIAAVVAVGSLAGGDLELYVIDENLQSDRAQTALNQMNSIWKWTAGGVLPIPEEGFQEVFLFNSSGITYAAQQADLVRDANGFFYKTQRRAAGQTQSGIFIVDPDGLLVTASRDAWIEYNNNLEEPVAVNIDTFIETISIDIYDGWLAGYRYAGDADPPINYGASEIQFVKIVTDEETGSPSFDFSQHFIIPTLPNTNVGRDISFDAAGNIYTVSSGQHLLRVYAPGGYTTATTASNGQFFIETGEPPTPPTGEPPVIGDATLAETTLTLTFTAAEGEAAAFAVQKSGTLAGQSWTEDTTAVITGATPSFTATITTTGAEQFYRIIVRE